MPDFLRVTLDWLRQVTPDQIKVYYWAALQIYASPFFYVGVAVILLLEKIRPAIREQRVLSRAFVEDFAWFNISLVLSAAALPAFAGLLEMVYTSVTGGFRVAAVASLALPLKVGISLVVFDFLQWMHHRVRHAVGVFWHFHVLHHSQRELNQFTDLRVHFAEYVVARTIEFVPMLMFRLNPFAIVAVGLATTWHTRLIHANVRTNFGPLKHVLVSPQYHRVHHSMDPAHHDRNFGVIFTCWDRIFGTLHSCYDVYPATGLAEVEFATPPGLSPGQWASHYWRQIAWPFEQLRWFGVARSVAADPLPGCGAMPSRDSLESKEDQLVG